MKHYILSLLLLLPLTINAQEQQKVVKRFQGIYAGASFGSQNIFGGAYIDDMDLLAQKSGFVFELLGGYRLQLLDRKLVVGAEYLYGFTDGDLSIEDPRTSSSVDYSNDRQIGLSVNLGFAFGNNRHHLAYFLIGQGRRNFDISIVDQNGSTYTQEDQQNFDRFGIGFETNLYRHLSARINVSKIFVDYGEMNVSQNVEDKLDFNLAFIFQL